jgi:hypothetical protein
MYHHPNFRFGFDENVLGKEKEICAEYKCVSRGGPSSQSLGAPESLHYMRSEVVSGDEYECYSLVRCEAV